MVSLGIVKAHQKNYEVVLFTWLQVCCWGGDARVCIFVHPKRSLWQDIDQHIARARCQFRFNTLIMQNRVLLCKFVSRIVRGGNPVVNVLCSSQVD